MTKIAFMASDAPEAQSALQRLKKRYGNARPGEADAIVALGGDGLMLRALHRFVSRGKAIYGMNRGSVGFLLNEYQEKGLEKRLAEAEPSVIHPLRMEAVSRGGARKQSIAFNEVSLLRQIHQAAKLSISIDGKLRLEELICDGVLVATPAGSTAYNLSAHGPILPINSQLLALTPISAFRPRRWRGALLPHDSIVQIDVLEREKRPVAAVADHLEVRDVQSVRISEDLTSSVTLLFDPGRNLPERILAEQFRF